LENVKTQKLNKTKSAKSLLETNKAFTSTLVFFISAFLFLVIKVLGTYNCFNFLGDYANLIINAFVQIGLMFLLPLFLYSLLSKTKIKKTFYNFQFKYIGIKTIITSFLLGIFMYFAVVLISTFCASFWNLIGYRNPSIPVTPESPDTSILTGLIIPIITTAILPAFCEEFANRGLLLNGLLNEKNAREAILFSSICFGLLHYNINQAIYAMVIGLVMGSLVYYTRSIFPAMIVHFTNNFLATYFSWATDANAFGSAFNNLLNTLFTGTFLSVFLKMTIVVFVVVTAIVVLMNEIHNQTKKNRLYDVLEGIAHDYLGDGEFSTDGGVVYDGQGKKTLKEQSYEGEVFVKMQEAVFKEIVEDRKKKSFLEKLVPKQKAKAKTWHWQDTFLVLTIFMTGLLTLFTLIWGFL